MSGYWVPLLVASPQTHKQLRGSDDDSVQDDDGEVATYEATIAAWIVGSLFGICILTCLFLALIQYYRARQLPEEYGRFEEFEDDESEDDMDEEDRML